RVTLATPLVFGHRVGTPARPLNPVAAGPTKAFADGVIVGDTCVFLDDLVGLGPDQVVEIDSTGQPPEYRRMRQFTATSGADGYFRWPPFSRVYQLEIEADRGGGSPVLHRFVTPEYGPYEHRVDLIFR